VFTFAARTGVLQSYITILHKELTKAQEKRGPEDPPMQNVEKDIFRKLGRGGFTTAFAFLDVVLSMFACESGLFSSQTQGYISAGATAVVCFFSICTLCDLCCCIQTKDPGSARSSFNKDPASAGGSINIEMPNYNASDNDD